MMISAKYFYCTIVLSLVMHVTFFAQNDLHRDTVLRFEVADGVELEGSLGFAGSSTVVLFIAGSGPTDRDCNSLLGLKTDAFRLLADTLKDAGISSFRYDKRGIGASTPVQEIDMTINDLIHDASFLVDTFSTAYENLVVLGHSEGVLIGSRVAAQNSNVSGFIAISGISQPLDVIVLEQLARYPKLVPLAEKYIGEIKAGDTLSDVHPILLSLFRPSVVPYLRSAFALNPVEEISKVTVPVLSVGGECDMQVPPSHARELANTATNNSLVILPGMGHTMKKLNADCSDNVTSYTDPVMPLHPSLVNAILNFMVAIEQGASKR